MQCRTPACRSASLRRATACIAAATLGLTVQATSADELLVSSFGADIVGRYDADSAVHLGNLAGGTVNGPQALRLAPNGLLYLANEEWTTFCGSIRPPRPTSESS